MATKESIELFMVTGKHNKTYVVELYPYGQGWNVDFAYGRIGSTLKHGTKTPNPLPYYTAKQVYDNLVQSKKAKGYTAGMHKVQGVIEKKQAATKQTVTVVQIEEPRGRKFRDAI